MQSSATSSSKCGLKETIKQSPSDIRGLARIIREEGRRLIEEEGQEPANVFSLQSTQLMRLIDGSINKCLNPHCNQELTAAQFHANPLIMTCNDSCTVMAVKAAAENAQRDLKEEIPELEKSIRGDIKDLSNPAVSKGDEADKASVQMGNTNEARLVTKRKRLEHLNQLLGAMANGKFKIECASDCGEEVPISARINSPEIGYCVACLAKRKRK